MNSLPNVRSSQEENLSPNEYQTFLGQNEVEILENLGESEKLMFLTLCLQEETGEVAKEIRRISENSKSADLDHLYDELGDVLCCLARIMNVAGFDLESLMEHNIKKVIGFARDRPCFKSRKNNEVPQVHVQSFH